MKLFDHILLKFYSFLIFSITIILIIIGFGLFETEVYDFLDFLYSSPESRLIYLVTAIIIAAISLRFLFIGSRGNSVPQTINQKNELGETRTSITTFETIASKAIQKVNGVREWQVRLKVSEIEGNHFFIKVVIDGDVPIPQITEQIQRDVKSIVEEITGIEIQQVSVLISDVITSSDTKPRRVE